MGKRPVCRNRLRPAAYRRLIENGKKPKVAIVACMRKMLTMLNAMMRDNTEWRGVAKSA